MDHQQKEQQVAPLTSFDNQDTALHKAVREGKYKDATILANQITQENVDIRNRMGSTPLLLACMKFDVPIELIQLLITKGADVNTKNGLGSSPLDFLCKTGRADLMNLLVQNGAKGKDLATQPISKIPNSKAAPQLTQTSTHDKKEVTASTLKKRRNKKRTQATSANNFGSLPNTIIILGEVPPLHLAAFKGDIKELNKLLSKKINLEEKNTLGDTALHSAVIGKQIDAASILLQKGANANAQNNGGDTPLHLATKQSNFDMVNLLCKHAANPNIKNSIGETSLQSAKMLALLSRNNSIVDLLSQQVKQPQSSWTLKSNNRQSEERKL